MLRPDISFDRLKGLIKEKLRFSPYEEITSIVYRLPINIINGAFIFDSMNITDDNEWETVLESHNSLVGQVQTLQLYAVVVESAVDLNTGLLPARDVAPSTVRQVTVENLASSSVYRPEFDPSYFSPRSDSPGGMANMAGCSIGPSSSHQTVGSGDDDGDYVPPDEAQSQSDSEEESLCSSFEAGSNEEMENFDEDDVDVASGLPDNDGEDDGTDAVPSQPTRCREYRHPGTNFFNEINIEAAGDPEWVDGMNSNEELRVGKVFQTKEAFKQAVKLFSITSGRDFRVFKSGNRDEEYRCTFYKQDPHKCKWRIRAAVYRNTRHWTVTRLGDDHTCVAPRENQDHRKLDSDVIASQIVGLVSDKPNIPVSQIQQVMLTQFRYQVTYRKAWRAKHKALKLNFGIKRVKLVQNRAATITTSGGDQRRRAAATAG